MTCMGKNVFCHLRSRSPILRQFAKNASGSTNFCRPSTKQGLRGHSSQYQGRRSRHCKRVSNPCVQKKIEEELKKRTEKKSFWDELFGKKKKKPPLYTCRLEQAKNKWKEEKIPDFIEDMCKDLPDGAVIYKTRGHAFILEVPCKKPVEKKKTRSEVLLAKMERDKRCITLEDERNPMPGIYTNPGRFYLDLQSRCLHPLYKKLEMPRSSSSKAFSLDYKTRCLDGKDIGKANLAQTPIYKRKKTTFANFKMGTLPKYLDIMEKEYRTNRYSCLETWRERVEACNFRFSPITQCPDIDCQRWNNSPPRKCTHVFDK